MPTKEKKQYQKPLLCKVDLTIEDAVLACCKTSAATNMNTGKRRCNQTGCTNTPTDLT